MKLLGPLRRSGTKAVVESANKLYDVLKKEAEGWKAEAETLTGSDPVSAYDLYTKVAAHFPTEAFGKAAADAKQKLATNKAVAAELAARKAYTQLTAGITAAGPHQKVQVLQQLKVFLKKHGDTPTGNKVAALAKELEK